MPIDPDRTTILAIVAQNENSVLHASSIGLGPVFEQMGYQQRILDMFTPSGGDELLQLLTSGQVAFAYGFAGVGSRLNLTTGANIWTASRTPFVSLWYDHPCHNYRQHIVDSPYVLNGYHVADHLEARRKYLPPSSSRSMLLPSMAEMFHPMLNQPLSPRKRNILYTKTAYKPSVLSDDWNRHSPRLREVLWTLVEQAKIDRNLDLAGAVAVLFAGQGVATDNLDLFMGVVQAVDNYIRAWRSDHFARALLRHPAHIVGRGWDYLKDEPHTAQFFDPWAFDEYFGRMLDYRIVANTNPLWRDGVHERSFLALSVGGILLTDRSVKSDKLFGNLTNYVGFEWQDNLEDAIATAFHLSDQDNADYFAAAEKAFHASDLYTSLEYFLHIERLVAAFVKEMA